MTNERLLFLPFAWKTADRHIDYIAQRSMYHCINKNKMKILLILFLFLLFSINFILALTVQVFWTCFQEFFSKFIEENNNLKNEDAAWKLKELNKIDLNIVLKNIWDFKFTNKFVMQKCFPFIYFYFTCC